MRTFGTALAVLSVAALVAAEIYFEEGFKDGEFLVFFLWDCSGVGPRVYVATLWRSSSVY